MCVGTFVYMRVRVFVCTHTCIYMYINILVCARVNICKHEHTHTHTSTCTFKLMYINLFQPLLSIDSHMPSLSPSV